MKRNLSAIFSILILFALFHSAPAQYFGKNHVQYKNFKTFFLQSQNFDIYFTENGRVLAEFVAETAEQSYRQLHDNFRYELADRITFIVYNSHNDFEQTNVVLSPGEESVGGFTEFYKNRIVIPFEGEWEKFRHVIHHELTHAVMLQMIYGAGFQSIIMGLTQFQLPLWFIEGMAEYQSRGWDIESDMFIRDAVLNDYAPKISHLNGFLAYKGGQSVFHFIAQTYGREKVGEVLDKVRFSRSLEGGLLQSIGMDSEALNAHWQKFLKKNYWPDIAKRQEPGEIAMRLTDHRQNRHFINNSPAFSPAGDKIAFLSDKSDYFDIFLMDAATGKILAKLISGQKSGKLEELHWLRPGISWSPDGRFIVFAAKAGKQDALHIVDVEKKKISRTLTLELDGLFSPSWSPQGNHIAFSGILHGQSDIYLVDLDSGKLQKITDDIFSDIEPSFSPDGNRIAFVSDRGKHVADDSLPANFKIYDYDYRNYDVYLANISTQAILRQHTNNQQQNVNTQNPAISSQYPAPSIQQQATQQPTTNNQQLANSYPLERITDTPFWEKSPVFSPDGDKLVYTSDRSGIYNIYLHDLSTGQAFPTTNLVSGAAHLAWSKNKNKLAFVSFNHAGYDIFLMANSWKQRPGEIPLESSHFLTKLENRRRIDEIEPGAVNAREDRLESKYSHYFQDANNGFGNGGYTSNWAFLDNKAVKTKDGQFKIKKYKLKFSPDFAIGAAGYSQLWGVQGAGQLAMSDIFGNHRLMFSTDLYYDFENSDYLLRYLYLPNRLDVGIGAFHQAFYFRSQNVGLMRDRYFGLNLYAAYPFDRFKRLESNLTWLGINRDFYEANDLATGKTRVLMASAAYVRDTAVWGWTGPINGERSELRMNFSPRYNRAHGLEFLTIRADYRKYKKLGRDFTLAIRFAGGASGGKNPQQFYLGGVENWINQDYNDKLLVDEPESIYFSSFELPLRGASYYESIGNRFLLTNIEFRFPLIRYLELGWPLRLGAANIRGAIFTDIGAAWERRLGKE
ncbi:MAG: peptidase MA family metallohydrolase, partial [bacterium]